MSTGHFCQLNKRSCKSKHSNSLTSAATYKLMDTFNQLWFVLGASKEIREAITKPTPENEASIVDQWCLLVSTN